MTTETFCWNCNKPYPITEPKCPHCRSTNANFDYEKAQAEQAGALEDSGDTEL